MAQIVKLALPGSFVMEATRMHLSVIVAQLDSTRTQLVLRFVSSAFLGLRKELPGRQRVSCAHLDRL